jgi:radical SAM protein with 4Fe4S-binding SPASM domain
MGIVGKSVTHIARDGTHVFVNPVSGGYAVTDSRAAAVVALMAATDDEDQVIEEIASELGLDPVAAAARYVGFAEHLRQRGMMDSAVAAEDGLPTPFFGFVEVTRKCPTLCRICAIDTGRGSEEILSLDEIKGVIDEFKAMGIKYLALTGGDPLVRDDLLEVLGHAKRAGLGAGFSTSLVTLREDVARALAPLGVQVQVSLDGSCPAINDYNRGAGSFDKAMRGMDLLRRHGVEFRIAFCIMKHNLADIPAMAELGERVGAKEIAFRKIKLLGRALDLKDEVYPSPQEMVRAYTALYGLAYRRDPARPRINSKYTEVFFGGRGALVDRLPCGAGRNIVHVTYRGDIVPCSLFTEEQFVVGNVRRDSIARVWETSKMLDFFRSTRVDDIPKCRECNYRYLCGGGCRAEAYFLQGDLRGECCDCGDLVAFYDYLVAHAAASEQPVSI